MKPRHHRSLARRRKGAALVEFAMTFPIILAVFTAMIEISRVLLLQHTVDTAAYEAARSAMVPGATATDAKEEAAKLLSVMDLSDASITVTPSEITEETALITVRVEVPVAANSWITPNLFTSFAVQSEVTLFCERSPIIRLTGIPGLKAKKDKLKGKKPTL